SKIKEMRRLEALTSLGMITHGAMFTAWETGQLPKTHQALLDAAALRADFLDLNDDKSFRWKPERQVVVSDIYNTRLFATPLIELSIDKVTQPEADSYAQFRHEYLDLWRQFFDPVGVRLSLNEQRAKVEIYVLPLIRTQGYAGLRGLAGDR